MSQSDGRLDVRAILSLVIISCIAGLNTVDRNMFGLLLPQIKADIEISDAALGFLIGPAFMIVYSVAGLPIAWLADRSSRRNIVAAGLGFWSVITVFTGFAQSLGQLLTARMALGVGEASSMAPSSAMIGDLFRDRHRVAAMAVFTAGGPLAILIFFPIIGAIAADGDWRSAYYLMGTIGIVVAVIAMLAIREPVRESAAHAAEVRSSGLFETSLAILRLPSFALLCTAGVMISISLGAIMAWLPSFMQRVHGLTPQETGTLLGLYRGGFGIVATVTAGVAVTLLMRLDRRWLLWSPMILAACLVPAQGLLLLSDDPIGWHIGLALDSILMSAITPCLFAVLITVLDPRIRATGAALYLLIFNLVGQSLGPLTVGALNDAMAELGPQTIRHSMLIAPAAIAIAAALIFLLSRRRALVGM